MINQNEQYLEKRWLEYWNKENHDRPIMSVNAVKNNAKYKTIERPATVKECWMDWEYIVKANRNSFENTFFGGEAFPLLNPNLGPDIVGAVCGCELEFSESTSWALHNVKDWESHPPIVFEENNKWWQAIKQMTEYYVKDSQGDYFVGITDLHPGTDGLVSLRGPQELCMDIYDCPQEINSRIDQIFAVYKEMYNRLNAIISKKQQGTANWMGIWHPKANWYVVGSDFSCLVGKDDYEQYVAPGLLNEIDFLDASIYHLDGPGALKHLDRILQMEKLNGVQWVYGSGQPTARYWIEVLQKIQKAGKNIQIHCVPEDIKDICEALKPEGVHIVCGVQTEDDAKDLIKMAERIYKK